MESQGYWEDIQDDICWEVHHGYQTVPRANRECLGNILSAKLSAPLEVLTRSFSIPSVRAMPRLDLNGSEALATGVGEFQIHEPVDERQGIDHREEGNQVYIDLAPGENS